jgi:hypothetical protein
MNTQDEKLTNLLNWGFQHNCHFNNLEIKYISKDNRYVVAAENLKVYSNLN